MEEESLSTVLTVVVPAAVGVSLVVATIAIIFWLGAGRQTSYEDAVKARQGHAEKELRKMAEKEREQRQRKEKKRPGRGRRHEAGRPEGETAESTPQQLPPATQKSILKSSKPNSVPKVDSSSVSRVDFEMSETPAKPNKIPRTNPPTPHPSARHLAPPLARSLEPEVGEEEEDDDEPDERGIPRATRIEPQKRSHPDEDQRRPKQKPAANQAPPAAATKRATATAAGTTAVTKSAAVAGGAVSRGQKKSKKATKTMDPGEVEGLSASRISDIVTASSLTDEEIQNLIDKLLEMMEANAEWKGASRGMDSVKSLKKANDDLQKRCLDAEKTVQAHFSKIKELRSEIKSEQSRRQLSEGQLQAKITKQGGEITIFKTKVGGLEEELRQTKQLSSAQTLKHLEEDNATLTHQMTTLVQENTSLTSQLAARNKSLQEAQEQSTRLHSDLRRAKSAAKSPTGGAEGRGQAAELEARLRQVEEDNTSLQAALTSVGREKDQLVEQVQSLAGASREIDSLSQQLSTAKQQLQEAQVAVQAMEQKGVEGGAELRQLSERNAQLTSQLTSQLELLHQQSASQTAAAAAELRQLQEQNEAVQQQSLESAAATAAEVQRLRETNSRLETQVEGLQSTAASTETATLPPQGPSQEEVEEMKCQLKVAHEEEERALVAKMGAERTSEVAGLKGQYETELHGVKEELARVRREGEEARSSAEQQLASETAMKQVEEMKCQLKAAHEEEERALVAKMGAERTSEVAGLKGQYETELHGVKEELARVRREGEEARSSAEQQLASETAMKQVEEMKCQLKAAHEEEEERALVAKMGAERTSEVAGLKGQYETELHGVKEELARVRREGEEARSSAEQQLASETAMKQELELELEALKTPALSSQQNGPIHDQVDGSGDDVKAKEEELVKVQEERDGLKDTLQTVESKMNELQGKNNALRDNCWKARDDSARLQKESEAKLKQVYRETESRVKVAEERVEEEKDEGERALLQRLFPDLRVSDTASFSAWVDQFELEAQLSLENTLKKVCELKQRVEELEETEQTYIQEAQGFRETLNLTLGSLAKLQAQVTSESVKHQRLLEERDEMLQMERGTNRDLQQQLSKERATVTNLEEEIKKAGEGGGEEDKVREQLEEAAQAGEELRREVDRLNTSLDQAAQLRTQAEDSVHELKSRCEELERKLQDREQSLQSTVELGKLGQSIVQMPSDSTEV